MFKRSLPSPKSGARGSEKHPTVRPLSGGKASAARLAKGMPGVHRRTGIK